MVQRRCHFIIVSDAGFDPDCEFEDLGNAIRKIRVDFGIPIDLRPVPLPLYSRKSEKPGKYCAVGTIRYSVVDGDTAPDGVLVDIKPVFYGKESLDVFHYAQANKGFPREPTSDLWFNESQVESYRQLEFHVIQDTITEIRGKTWKWNGRSIGDFAAEAARYQAEQQTSRIFMLSTLVTIAIGALGALRGSHDIE